MLRDVLKVNLQHAHDIIVVADVLDRTKLVAVATDSGAQLVIVGGDGDLPLVYVQLLHAIPRLRALAISDDGRVIKLHELHLRHTRLGNASPGELSDAIRAAVPDEAGR